MELLFGGNSKEYPQSVFSEDVSDDNFGIIFSYLSIKTYGVGTH